MNCCRIFSKDRTRTAKITGVNSEISNATNRVPQGSILGPFAVYNLHE